jgi:hypothetical protein
MSMQLYRALLIYISGLVLAVFGAMFVVAIVLDVPLVLEHSHRDVLLPSVNFGLSPSEALS